MALLKAETCSVCSSVTNILCSKDSYWFEIQIMVQYETYMSCFARGLLCFMVQYFQIQIELTVRNVEFHKG